MAAASLAQLETCAKDLTSALHAISAGLQRPGVAAATNGHGSPPVPLVAPEAPREVQQARRLALNTASRIQTLLGDHCDFLQRLARHNQMLACLQWLCHFQVLACIPMDEAVSVADIAALARVPESELCRVLRMMATAGFLHETQEGYVAHTALSAAFVAQPAIYDAAVFLAETAAPVALNMTTATEQAAGSHPPAKSISRSFSNKASLIGPLCNQQPKFRRQWPAYLRYGLGDDDAAITELFLRLDWGSLGTAKVVHVGAQSITVAVELTTLFPAIRFVVQLSEVGSNTGREAASATNGAPEVDTSLRELPPRMLGGPLSSVPVEASSRISVQHRACGTTQLINDGSVYILHLPSPTPSTSFQSIAAQIKVELEAHLDVLRARHDSRLIVTARILSEPGSVDVETEAAARMRELSLQQLGSGRDIEIADVRNIVLGLRDNSGGLVVTNEFRSPSSSVVALEAKYQAFRPSLFDLGVNGSGV